MHLVTRTFCHDLREGMERFVNGESLRDLPALESQVARLLPTNMSERPVERKHRMISMELGRAYYVGAPRLSLRERAPKLAAILTQHPEAIYDLARICDEMYHPVCAAQRLGLSNHPSCREAFGAQIDLGPTGVHSKTVKEVVYHLDMFSQNMVLDIVDAPGPPAPRPEGKLLPGAPGAGVGSSAGPSVPPKASSAHAAASSSHGCPPAEGAPTAKASAPSTRASAPGGTTFGELLSRYCAEHFFEKAMAPTKSLKHKLTEK